MVRFMATPDSIVGPINIGNPTEFTILQLASQVIEMTGSRSKIVHRPKPQDDPRQRRPDISKVQELLKWSPRTSIKDGLKTTISYFEELLKDQGVSVPCPTTLRRKQLITGETPQNLELAREKRAFFRRKCLIWETPIPTLNCPSHGRFEKRTRIRSEVMARLVKCRSDSQDRSSQQVAS